MTYGFLKFLVRGRSQDAACHIVEVAQYMTAESCRTMADYLRELAAAKDRRASQGKAGE